MALSLFRHEPGTVRVACEGAHGTREFAGILEAPPYSIWTEGDDLLLEANGFLRVGPLPRPTVEYTNARIIHLLRSEPHSLHTLTSDNGVEFHGYKLIEQALGLTAYFALPHHAWERGTSENTNGLLRQYLPKGSSLANLTQRHCHDIAAILNHRPRRRLGYRTPHEVYLESVLPTRG